MELPQPLKLHVSMRSLIANASYVQLSREVSDHDAQKYLAVCVTGMVMIGLLADLEGTKAHRHEIKMLCKKLSDIILRDLGKSSDKVDKATNTTGAFYRVMAETEALVKELINMPADDFVLVTRFTELLYKNRDALIDHFNKYEDGE